METLVEQAVRLATNVKAHQTKAQDAGMELLEKKIEKEHLLDHKVVLFLLDKEQISPNLAGLVANKIMAKYQRPVAVLTKKEKETLPWESPNPIEVIYSGSARGCTLVGATEFKKLCESFDKTLLAAGHNQAFGLSLPQEAIQEFLEYTDKAYEHVADEAVYHVDAIIPQEEINDNPTLEKAILNIGFSDNLWGTNLEEPYIALENIIITKDMVQMYEKRDITLKIELTPEIALMKFKISTDEQKMFKNISATGSLKISFIGKCRVNSFNGKISAQIEIIDYEVNAVKKYDF